MMSNFFIGAALLLLSLHAAAAAKSTGSDDVLDAGLPDDARAAGSPAVTAVPAVPPVTAVRVVAPPTVAPAERALSANPLWAIPLTQLSTTRERPIFSPSRRPPPAAVAAESTIVKAPAVRKREPEVPQLALVGTIASDEEGFGIFLDQSTKGALRLKVGEEYQGWKLRAIRGREVTMEKDQRAAVLTLPPLGAAQPGGEVRLLPASAERIPTLGRH
jgi:general secretion pathway protein N